MSSFKHMVRGFTVGLALAVLGGMLVPERYEIKAQARNLDAPSWEAGDPASGEVKGKEIPTVFGDLFLGYSNGEARLAGDLFAGNPCGTWDIETLSSPGTPVMVEFRVESRGPQTLCIQDLGEKDPLHAETPAGPKTLYIVRMDRDIIFSGELPLLKDAPLTDI